MSIDYKALEVFYSKIRETCVEYFINQESVTVIELADRCMHIEGLPMHCPPHHFMIPAVLLTMCHKQCQSSLETLQEDLEEADKRAHNVLGGFCGLYGSCGAAVGVGIFMSIYTQTGPCSETTWAWTNRATAEALMDISEIDGPRCCKRNSYLSLLKACDLIKEYLNIELVKPEQVICRFYSGNKECKGTKCPFFQKEQ